MDLSIIIAHYDPGDYPSCIESFHKTLNQIECQKGDYEMDCRNTNCGSYIYYPHMGIQHENQRPATWL